MMNLPSAESLMLSAPNEVLEDILARKIYEASIAGSKEVMLEGTSWKREDFLIKLQIKGYHTEVFNKRFLKVYWD